MSDSLNMALRRFRRQLASVRVLRVAAVVLLVIAIPWGWWPSAAIGRGVVLLALAAAFLLWIALAFGAFRCSRALETGQALLNTGQLDDAEIWLHRAMVGLSLSPYTPIRACQELAMLFARRDHHHDVVVICRELLGRRLRRLRQIWVNTSLLLADSLLCLDRVGEAYEAIRPLHDAPLSLSDRMRLLPVQLRYELAANRTDAAAAGLAEKVQLAELLDSPRAALVHALLAEACRREAMPAQQRFLAERAHLYWDLKQLAERYPVIAPIASESG